MMNLNPAVAAARLKAAVIAILLAVVVILGLVVWALAERNWRLAAEKDVVTLKAQVGILGRDLEEQNKAVDRWQDAAKEAQERGRAALAAAARVSAAKQVEIDRLQGLILVPPAHGAACPEALSVIRQSLNLGRSP